MSTTKAEPLIGVVSSYWGGGFVADLGHDGEYAANVS